MLAIALHRQLLEIGGETFEILFIGKHCDGLDAEEIVVPHAQQAQEHRQVRRERGGAEVLVHLVEAGQHRSEIVRPDSQHR